MPLPTREAIATLLDETLSAMVAGTFGPVPDPPSAVKSHLDDLVAKREHTVRDGLLTLLAMEVEHGQVIDWAEQPLYNQARSASRDLGSMIYPRLHIAGSREALQTGVKGVERYIDRRNTPWKAVLEWASQRKLDPQAVVDDVAREYGMKADEIRRGTRPDTAEARFVVTYAGAEEALAPAETEQDDESAWPNDPEARYDLAKGVRKDAETEYGVAHIAVAFHYLAAAVAKTARNLPPMPPLDTPKLTFPAVFALLDEMLSKPSAGAHEQFVFAALLAAWREQLGEPGVVETKNLNASDASAGTAADVQEKYRGQVTEAYEVTAAAWDTKVDQAEATLRRHDLPRVHILAKDAARATGDEVAAAIPAGLDLTVRDVREESRSVLARLSKPYRRDALARLYDLLVDKQPDDSLVQGYVAAVTARGLIESE